MNLILGVLLASYWLANQMLESESYISEPYIQPPLYMAFYTSAKKCSLFEEEKNFVEKSVLYSKKSQFFR